MHDVEDATNFLESKPFGANLHDKAYREFKRTLRPPLNKNKLALHILANRFVSSLPVKSFTPYVVTEHIYGHRWPEQVRQRQEAEREGEYHEDLVAHSDLGAAASACEFLLGIRPAMISSGATPLTRDTYMDILGGIYVQFAPLRPLFGGFADQREEVIEGFNLTARKYLDPLAYLVLVQ